MAATIDGGIVVRSTPAANTNADVILPAVAGTIYQIKSIIASYSAVPTGGRLGVLSGAAIVFDIDVVAGGPIPFYSNITEDIPNTTMTIRLFAGGAGIIGKLTVSYVPAVVA